jgi:hypothetical protein
MNELAVTLPAEIEQMAQSVSIEKRNEVQSVLNHVFNGVAKMRDQLDLVVVTDENDKVNMKLANTIRLGVRQVRLDAEKEFDMKRSEVQKAMLSFKTEDALWLKAKQTMQILTKEIEETAKWKEATKERIEAERKELKLHERIMKVLKFAEIMSSEFENMSDSMFDLFLAGLEKQYNDKIEAEKKAEADRIETERVSKLHTERKESILHLWQFVAPANFGVHFGVMPESEWIRFVEILESAKKIQDAENERIRIENERLQKEADQKAKELEAVRVEAERIQKEKTARDNKRNEELRPYIVFIRHYSEILNMDEIEYQKEFAEVKIGAEQHYEQQRNDAAKQLEIDLLKEAEISKAISERVRIEAELKTHEDAELKRVQEEKQRQIDEAAALIKASKAPDKERLTAWVNSMLINAVGVSNMNEQSIAVANSIFNKFSAFKEWAKSEIEKL